MNTTVRMRMAPDLQSSPFLTDLVVETLAQRHQRYTQLVCLVVCVVAVFALALCVVFSLTVSWTLWSGSAVASLAWAIPAFLIWRLAWAGKSLLAARITILTLACVSVLAYWQAPYFALYLLFLFIMTVVHILVGSRETLVVGLFLFANTLIYALMHHNHMYAPDGQEVTVDYGTFALWWVLLGGTGWLVSFLYHTMQRDNHILHHQTTALRTAQLHLSESEERYRALSHAAFEGIVLHAQDSILEVNQTLAAMFGYEAGELVGHSLQELIQNQALPASPAPDMHRSWEALALRKDGSSFPVECQSRYFVYRGQTIQVSAIRDISARKKAEDALIQSQHQLLQAQKVESVGRLAGGIAHDFNNLLTVILSYSDLLELSLDVDTHTYTYLAQIREAGQRAAALTHQLLAFSRQQILHPQVLDLNARVRAMETLLHPVIGEDITVQTVLVPGVAQVLIDPGQFEQIVMNLALNARDAMPNGGLLTLETTYVTLHENAIWDQPTFVGKTGDYVMFAVSDTGVGMDESTQSRIFEPFFTTKEPGRGTGLGLATIAGIVQQSGGYIWVYSTPNIGTTFKVYLPRCTSKDVPAPAVHDGSGAPMAYRGSETILVVEDDAAVRQLVRAVLETSGYRVFTANNGADALTFLAQKGHCIDIILTDLIMPRMGGLELLTALRQTQTHARLIAMSGYTDRVVVQQGIFTLCDRYVQKPFTPGDLGRAVRDVLGSRADTISGLDPYR